MSSINGNSSICFTNFSHFSQMAKVTSEELHHEELLCSCKLKQTISLISENFVSRIFFFTVFIRCNLIFNVCDHCKQKIFQSDCVVIKFQNTWKCNQYYFSLTFVKKTVFLAIVFAHFSGKEKKNEKHIKNKANCFNNNNNNIFMEIKFFSQNNNNSVNSFFRWISEKVFGLKKSIDYQPSFNMCRNKTFCTKEFCKEKKKCFIL